LRRPDPTISGYGPPTASRNEQAARKHVSAIISLRAAIRANRLDLVEAVAEGLVRLVGPDLERWVTAAVRGSDLEVAVAVPPI